MKEIQLTQGQVAKVCDCHAHLVEGRKWCAIWTKDTQSYRAIRNTSVAERLLGSPSTVYMHAVINGTPKGLHTDHINHNTLDNRCENLRTVTPSQNQMNQSKHTNNHGKFKGVSWNKQRRKWQAEIRMNGKSEYLGLFSDAATAAGAYDRKAIEAFGEFASLNFPRSDYP